MVFTDSFEEDLDEWNLCFSNGCGKAQLIQDGHNSNQAVQVSYVDADHPGIYRYVGNFKRGESYQVSIWCKALFEETCHLGFGDLPNGENPGSENAQDAEANGNEQWQLLRTKCAILTNDELMSVHLYSKGNGLTAIYDNLQVEKVANCP